MKELKYLNAEYKSSEIVKLVDWIQYTSLKLPENQNYYLELNKNTINIYGIKEGITTYNLSKPKEEYVKSISAKKESVELEVEYGDIEKIILHLQKQGENSIDDTLNKQKSSITQKRKRSSHNDYTYDNSGDSLSIFF